MSKDQEDKEMWAKALKEGRAKSVCVTPQRSGQTGRVGLHRLHLLENQEAKRIKGLYPFHRVRIELDPDTGLMYSFVMPEESYLELMHAQHTSPSEQSEVRRIQNVRNGVDSAHRAAALAVQKLEAGQIQHYEDIEAIAGEHEGEAFAAALTQAYRPALTLTNEEGQTITVGGHPKLPRQVPRRGNSHFSVEVRALDRDGRPNGTAKIKVLQIESDDARTRYVPERIYSVHLRTRSDVRSLELLGKAMALRLPVRVEVGVWVNLRAREHPRSDWLRAIDEEALLRQIMKSNDTVSADDVSRTTV